MMLVKENEYILTSAGYVDESKVSKNSLIFTGESYQKPINIKTYLRSYYEIRSKFEYLYIPFDSKLILSKKATDYSDTRYMYNSILDLNEHDYIIKFKPKKYTDSNVTKLNIKTYLINNYDYQVAFTRESILYKVLYKPVDPEIFDATLLEHNCESIEELSAKLLKENCVKYATNYLTIDTEFLDVVFEIITNNYKIQDKSITFFNKNVLSYFEKLGYNIKITSQNFTLTSSLFYTLIKNNFFNYNWIKNLNTKLNNYLFDKFKDLEFKFFDCQSEEIFQNFKLFFELNDLLVIKEKTEYNLILNYDTQDYFILIDNLFYIPITEIIIFNKKINFNKFILQDEEIQLDY